MQRNVWGGKKYKNIYLPFFGESWSIGFSMLHLLDCYAISMGLLWDLQILLDFKGMSMGFPLDSYEICMVFCMIFQKDFYGVSMGFKIDFYGIPMVFPLDSYGIPSAFLWDFNDMSIYGISMGLITLGLQSKVIQLKSTGNHLKVN